MTGPAAREPRPRGAVTRRTVLKGTAVAAAIVASPLLGSRPAAAGSESATAAGRFMAARIGARTADLESSHASPVSHPQAIADLIFAAALA